MEENVKGKGPANQGPTGSDSACPSDFEDPRFDDMFKKRRQKKPKGAVRKREKGPYFS